MRSRSRPTPTKYPDPVAKAMCDELKKQGVTKGSVAITQNNHNATEDKVAKVFAESMKKYCPNLTVLDVQLEGPEPTQAIAVATSIIQANPDLVAGFSTTGGGPTTWAGAQKETGKKVLSVGMDATQVNLDLVKNGEVWGLVAQPLYDETFGSADLLYKMANGEKVPYWTVLEAPLVTKDNEQPFYDLLAKLEPKFRKDAKNPDEKPAAAPAKEGAVKGKFYWIQNSAWHPVHQYTQQGFLAGCEAQGLDCELATTDENSIDALVALADQVVSRPDTKGVAMWFGGLPVAKPIIEKAKAKGIAVALPHFPVAEGFYADNAVQIAADPTKYPDPVAKAMCDELKKQGVTKGSVAITQNNHNATEDMVAKVFAESMKKYCPDLTILDVQLEGPEPPRPSPSPPPSSRPTPTWSPASPPPAAAPPRGRRGEGNRQEGPLRRHGRHPGQPRPRQERRSLGPRRPAALRRNLRLCRPALQDGQWREGALLDRPRSAVGNQGQRAAIL